MFGAPSFGGPNQVFLVNIQPAQPIHLDVNETAVALYKVGGVLKEDARTLQKQDVDSDALPYLTEDSLTKMGIPTFGRRVKILKAAQAILSGAAGAAPARPAGVAPAPSLSATTPMPVASPSRPTSVSASSVAAPLPRRPSPEPSPTAVQGAPADDDAGERDEEEYEQVDDVDPKLRELEAKEAAAAAKAASAGSGDSDDMFATEEAQTGDSFMAVKPWLGAIKEPSNPPKNNGAAPDKKLVIDWVHGYHAYETRNNLVYNKDGNIVYPIAGLVVVYNQQDKKQRYFQGHNDDVRCIARHPTNQNLIASGQNASIVNGKSQPPYICVWDSSNPESGKSYTIKGIQADRAIRAVSFIGDGKYLAAVMNDDNHMVKIFDWKTGTKVCEAKGDANAIWGIRANPRDPAEFATIGFKHLTFWKFDGSAVKGKKATMDKQALTFYSVAFSESGFAVCGCEDGNAYVFKGGQSSKVLAWHPKGKVLSIEPYNGGFISGGSDKTVRVWDGKLVQSKVHTFSEHVHAVYPSASGSDLIVGTRAGDVFEVKDFMGAEPLQGDKNLDAVTRGHADGELWAVAIAAGGNNFVTAGEDNTICLWDVKKRKMLKRAEISDKKGKAPLIKKASTMSKYPVNQCARGIAISPDRMSIVIGCNNGEVAVFDTKTLQRKYLLDLNKYGKRQVTDQTGNWIEVIRFSPSGRTCAVGTHGSVVCLLDPNDDYKCKGQLAKSSSAITSLDWSAAGDYIQTVDLGYELLFYSIDEDNLANSKQQTNASAVKDVEWASQTCKLGWPVQGIFDPSQKGSDINSCDASPSKSLVVTGDDNGDVKLFRYPCLKGAKGVPFGGHSSHVVTTRFTPDEKFVISTGGNDKSIIQWSVQ